MPITPRERLARVLDGSQAPGAFSAQLSVSARDVRLAVAGAGAISLPVRAPQAKRMIASARPSRFGRGEQTLMDLSVRDTWEITPDQVTLTGLDWDAILAEVRDELRLPARARLRAELHALLVYGEGSVLPTAPGLGEERHDDRHAGGVAAVVAHRRGTAHRAQRQDRRIPGVRGRGVSGCLLRRLPASGQTGQGRVRVTFTCNLLLDCDPAGEAPAEPSAEAARYLTEHFTTRVSRGKATTGSRRTGSSTCWITSTPSAG